MTIIDIELPQVTHEDEPTTATAAPPALVRPSGAKAAPPVVTPAPEAAPRAPRRRLFADMAGPLSGSWVIGLAVAWVVVVAVGHAVQPVPVDPDAPVPLIADVLNTFLLGTLGAMAAGMFQRRRFTAVASMAGATGLLALTLGCPLSGHHTFGAWWGVQIVGAVALLAISRRALRSS
jgi:hypothetical protein